MSSANNRGFLVRNEQRAAKDAPEHVGALNLDGREYRLEAWVKEKHGKKYFRLIAIPPAAERKVEVVPDEQPAAEAQPEPGAGEVSANEPDPVSEHMKAYQRMISAAQAFWGDKPSDWFSSLQATVKHFRADGVPGKLTQGQLIRIASDLERQVAQRDHDNNPPSDAPESVDETREPGQEG